MLLPTIDAKATKYAAVCLLAAGSILKATNWLHSASFGSIDFSLTLSKPQLVWSWDLDYSSVLRKVDDTGNYFHQSLSLAHATTEFIWSGGNWPRKFKFPASISRLTRPHLMDLGLFEAEGENGGTNISHWFSFHIVKRGVIKLIIGYSCPKVVFHAAALAEKCRVGHIFAPQKI
jgi:hypothetical protein